MTEPTCTEGGYTTFTCSVCGDSYNGMETDALGHCGEWEVVTEVSCTEFGVLQRDCARCGYSETKYVSPIDHSYVLEVIEPTCTNHGYNRNVCTVCGDTKIDWDSVVSALGHDWGEATCTEASTCARCGETSGGALGHDYGEWIVVTAATCTDAGEERHDCSRCGYSETLEIAAVGHSCESVVTEATCTEDGYTIHTCTICGHSYVDSEIEALGHDWADATCTDPRTCARCGETEGEALGHTYESVVTAPTCVAGGYTTHTCSNCGHSYVDSETEIDPENHVGEVGTECECGVYLPYCGTVDGVVWTLDQNGRLTVSGQGAVEGTAPDQYPWYAYNEQVIQVVIESGVNVGSFAFNGYPNLEKAVISEGVAALNSWVFAECPKLAEVSLPGTLKTIGACCFTWSGLENITLPEGLETIEAEAFYGSALTQIVIPNTVTALGSNAFESCVALKTVVLSNACELDNPYIFANCTALEAIVIPEGVTVIGWDVFENCTALTSVTLPETLQTLGVDCFGGCTALTEVTIPAGVTQFIKPFTHCTGLETITFLGDAPMILDDTAFEGMTVTIIYPAGNDTWTEDVMRQYGGTITWQPDCEPLEITKQPEDVSVSNGETATVTVEAEGEGLTYKWYFKNAGGSKFTLTKTFTGNTYTMTMNETRAGRQIYCVITDKYGNSVKSDVVILEMK